VAPRELSAIRNPQSSFMPLHPPESSRFVDPDAAIPDLVRRLTDDSKRLIGDEVRLAKLEVGESVKSAAHGTLWLSVAFGVGVVTAIALTVCMVAAIGALASGHMWVGAIATGLIELGVAFYLIKRGLKRFREPSYTFHASREALQDTASWIAAQRAD
jgi:putative superfamily III holin-X